MDTFLYLICTYVQFVVEIFRLSLTFMNVIYLIFLQFSKGSHPLHRFTYVFRYNPLLACMNFYHFIDFAAIEEHT